MDRADDASAGLSAGQSIITTTTNDAINTTDSRGFPLEGAQQQRPPPKLSFSENSSSLIRCVPNERAIFFVKIDCDEDSDLLPLQFEWSRGELPIANSDRLRITQTSTAVQLAVEHVQREDAGHYTLIARTKGNNVIRKDVELIVEDRSTGEDPPVFLRRLVDLSVKVGTRTRLLVEIRSSTDVKLTWYRNDRRICENDRINEVNEGNFHYLEVSPVILEDGGQWMVLAENSGGRNSCIAHLNVLVPKAYKAPEFIEELRAVLTQQGTVSLECKVIGVPTPQLRWFKDSKEIKAGDVFALTANMDDPTSLGTYTCEAVNCMGKSYSSSKVHVVGRGSREGSLKPADSIPNNAPPPIFTNELRDMSVRIGEPIILGCQVVVPPWPKTVVWYNKNGRIESGERYKLIEDGLGVYMIEIKPSESCDEGEWKCVVTSYEGCVGISTCNVTMDIPKNYRKPRFMESLRAVLTEEGLVSFECKVVGFPTPLLKWFKDGQELKPGDVYQLTGTNSLGTYCCVAKNCMGESSSVAVLTVEDIQNQLNDEERLLFANQNQPPKFVVGLKSQEAKINESFQFTVNVKATPDPVLSWFRDELPVENSERYSHYRGEQENWHLDIRCIEFVDQAEWKCVAVNDFGTSVTSSYLKLQIPRHYKKPRFLECLRAVLTEEGAVNLECKVIGVPQPVLKWYKDGVELKPGDIHRIISGQDGTCCLGTYTCEARNCMGVVASSASLLGFEEAYKAQKEEKAQENELQRNFSLSTIQEEHTSQLYETPVGDITIDSKGEVSFSFDGKEVSVSLYETPDLTEEEALKIVEMYADQISEHVTEHNVVELPPLRFVKETSQSGKLLMEAVVIDISPEYFTHEEDMRTEAGLDDISITEITVHGSSGHEDEVDREAEKYAQRSFEKMEEELSLTAPMRKRKKSRPTETTEEFYSLSKASDSQAGDDDDTSDLQTFASATQMSSRVESAVGPDAAQTDENIQPPKRKKGKRLTDSDSSKTNEDDAKMQDISGAVGDGLITVKPVKVISSAEEIEENVRALLPLAKLLKTIEHHLTIVENEVVEQAAMMMTPASAEQSIAIIRNIADPIKQVQSKLRAYSGETPLDVLFQTMEEDIRKLHRSLQVIEKCVEIDETGVTLIQRTSVCIIDSVGDQLIKALGEVQNIAKCFESTSLRAHIDLTADDIKQGLEITQGTIKSQALLQEAQELEAAKHLSETVAKLQAMPEIEPVSFSQISDAKLPDEADALKLICLPVVNLQAALEKVENELSLEENEEQIYRKVHKKVLDNIVEPIKELQSVLETIERKAELSGTQSTEQKVNNAILDIVTPALFELNKGLEVILNQSSDNVQAGMLTVSTVESMVPPLQEIQNGLAQLTQDVERGHFNEEAALDSADTQKLLQTIAQSVLHFETNIERISTRLSPNVQKGLYSLKEEMSALIGNVLEENITKYHVTLLENLKRPIDELNYCIRQIESKSNSGSLTDFIDPLHSLSDRVNLGKEIMHMSGVKENEKNLDVLERMQQLIRNVEIDIEEHEFKMLQHEVELDEKLAAEQEKSFLYMREAMELKIAQDEAGQNIQELLHTVTEIEATPGLDSQTQEVLSQLDQSLTGLVADVELLKESQSTKEENEAATKVLTDIAKPLQTVAEVLRSTLTPEKVQKIQSLPQSESLNAVLQEIKDVIENIPDQNEHHIKLKALPIVQSVLEIVPVLQSITNLPQAITAVTQSAVGGKKKTEPDVDTSVAKKPKLDKTNEIGEEKLTKETSETVSPKVEQAPKLEDDGSTLEDISAMKSIAESLPAESGNSAAVDGTDHLKAFEANKSKVNTLLSQLKNSIASVLAHCAEVDVASLQLETAQKVTACLAKLEDVNECIADVHQPVVVETLDVHSDFSECKTFANAVCHLETCVVQVEECIAQHDLQDLSENSVSDLKTLALPLQDLKECIKVFHTEDLEQVISLPTASLSLTSAQVLRDVHPFILSIKESHALETLQSLAKDESLAHLEQFIQPIQELEDAVLTTIDQVHLSQIEGLPSEVSIAVMEKCAKPILDIREALLHVQAETSHSSVEECPTLQVIKQKAVVVYNLLQYCEHVNLSALDNIADMSTQADVSALKSCAELKSVVTELVPAAKVVEENVKYLDVKECIAGGIKQIQDCLTSTDTNKEPALEDVGKVMKELKIELENMQNELSKSTTQQNTAEVNQRVAKTMFKLKECLVHSYETDVGKSLDDIEKTFEDILQALPILEIHLAQEMFTKIETSLCSFKASCLRPDGPTELQILMDPIDDILKSISSINEFKTIDIEKSSMVVANLQSHLMSAFRVLNEVSDSLEGQERDAALKAQDAVFATHEFIVDAGEQVRTIELLQEIDSLMPHLNLIYDTMALAKNYKNKQELLEALTQRVSSGKAFLQNIEDGLNTNDPVYYKLAEDNELDIRSVEAALIRIENEILPKLELQTPTADDSALVDVLGVHLKSLQDNFAKLNTLLIVSEDLHDKVRQKVVSEPSITSKTLSDEEKLYAELQQRETSLPAEEDVSTLEDVSAIESLLGSPLRSQDEHIPSSSTEIGKVDVLLSQLKSGIVSVLAYGSEMASDFKQPGAIPQVKASLLKLEKINECFTDVGHPTVIEPPLLSLSEASDCKTFADAVCNLEACVVQVEECIAQSYLQELSETEISELKTLAQPLHDVRECIKVFQNDELEQVLSLPTISMSLTSAQVLQDIQPFVLSIKESHALETLQSLVEEESLAQLKQFIQPIQELEKVALTNVEQVHLSQAESISKQDNVKMMERFAKPIWDIREALLQIQEETPLLTLEECLPLKVVKEKIDVVYHLLQYCEQVDMSALEDIVDMSTQADISTLKSCIEPKSAEAKLELPAVVAQEIVQFLDVKDNISNSIKHLQACAAEMLGEKVPELHEVSAVVMELENELVSLQDELSKQSGQQNVAESQAKIAKVMFKLKECLVHTYETGVEQSLEHIETTFADLLQTIPTLEIQLAQDMCTKMESAILDFSSKCANSESLIQLRKLIEPLELVLNSTKAITKLHVIEVDKSTLVVGNLQSHLMAVFRALDEINETIDIDGRKNILKLQNAVISISEFIDTSENKMRVIELIQELDSFIPQLNSTVTEIVAEKSKLLAINNGTVPKRGEIKQTVEIIEDVKESVIEVEESELKKRETEILEATQTELTEPNEKSMPLMEEQETIANETATLIEQESESTQTLASASVSTEQRPQETEAATTITSENREQLESQEPSLPIEPYLQKAEQLIAATAELTQSLSKQQLSKATAEVFKSVEITLSEIKHLIQTHPSSAIEDHIFLPLFKLKDLIAFIKRTPMDDISKSMETRQVIQSTNNVLLEILNGHEGLRNAVICDITEATLPYIGSIVSFIAQVFPNDKELSSTSSALQRISSEIAVIRKENVANMDVRSRPYQNLKSAIFELRDSIEYICYKRQNPQLLFQKESLDRLCKALDENLITDAIEILQEFEVKKDLFVNLLEELKCISQEPTTSTDAELGKEFDGTNRNEDAVLLEVKNVLSIIGESQGWKENDDEIKEAIQNPTDERFSKLIFKMREHIVHTYDGGPLSSEGTNNKLEEVIDLLFSTNPEATRRLTEEYYATIKNNIQQISEDISKIENNELQTTVSTLYPCLDCITVTIKELMESKSASKSPKKLDTIKKSLLETIVILDELYKVQSVAETVSIEKAKNIALSEFDYINNKEDAAQLPKILLDTYLLTNNLLDVCIKLKTAEYNSSKQTEILSEATEPTEMEETVKFEAAVEAEAPVSTIPDDEPIPAVVTEEVSQQVLVLKEPEVNKLTETSESVQLQDGKAEIAESVISEEPTAIVVKDIIPKEDVTTKESEATEQSAMAELVKTEASVDEKTTVLVIPEEPSLIVAEAQAPQQEIISKEAMTTEPTETVVVEAEALVPVISEELKPTVVNDEVLQQKKASQESKATEQSAVAELVKTETSGGAEVTVSILPEEPCPTVAEDEASTQEVVSKEDVATKPTETVEISKTEVTVESEVPVSVISEESTPTVVIDEVLQQKVVSEESDVTEQSAIAELVKTETSGDAEATVSILPEEPSPTVAEAAASKQEVLSKEDVETKPTETVEIAKTEVTVEAEAPVPLISEETTPTVVNDEVLQQKVVSEESDATEQSAIAELVKTETSVDEKTTVLVIPEEPSLTVAEAQAPQQEIISKEAMATEPTETVVVEAGALVPVISEELKPIVVNDEVQKKASQESKATEQSAIAELVKTETSGDAEATVSILPEEPSPTVAEDEASKQEVVSKEDVVTKPTETVEIAKTEVTVEAEVPVPLISEETTPTIVNDGVLQQKVVSEEREAAEQSAIAELVKTETSGDAEGAALVIPEEPSPTVGEAEASKQEVLSKEDVETKPTETVEIAKTEVTVEAEAPVPLISEETTPTVVNDEVLQQKVVSEESDATEQSAIAELVKTETSGDAEATVSILPEEPSPTVAKDEASTQEVVSKEDVVTKPTETVEIAETKVTVEAKAPVPVISEETTPTVVNDEVLQEKVVSEEREATEQSEITEQVKTETSVDADARVSILPEEPSLTVAEAESSQQELVSKEDLGTELTETLESVKLEMTVEAEAPVTVISEGLTPTVAEAEVLHKEVASNESEVYQLGNAEPVKIELSVEEDSDKFTAITSKFVDKHVKITDDEKTPEEKSVLGTLSCLVETETVPQQDKAIETPETITEEATGKEALVETEILKPSMVSEEPNEGTAEIKDMDESHQNMTTEEVSILKESLNPNLLRYYTNLVENIGVIRQMLQEETYTIVRKKLPHIDKELETILTISEAAKTVNSMGKSSEKMIILQKVLMNIFIHLDDLQQQEIGQVKHKIDEVKSMALNEYEIIEKSTGAVDSENILMTISDLIKLLVNVCREMVMVEDTNRGVGEVFETVVVEEVSHEEILDKKQEDEKIPEQILVQEIPADLPDYQKAGIEELTTPHSKFENKEQITQESIEEMKRDTIEEQVSLETKPAEDIREITDKNNKELVEKTEGKESEKREVQNEIIAEKVITATTSNEPKESKQALLSPELSKKLQEYFENIVGSVDSVSFIMTKAQLQEPHSKLGKVIPTLRTLLLVAKSLKSVQSLEKSAERIVSLQKSLMDIFITFDDFHEIATLGLKPKLELVKTTALQSYDKIESASKYVESENVLLDLNKLLCSILDVANILEIELQQNKEKLAENIVSKTEDEITAKKVPGGNENKLVEIKEGSKGKVTDTQTKLPVEEKISEKKPRDQGEGEVCQTAQIEKIDKKETTETLPKQVTESAIEKPLDEVTAAVVMPELEPVKEKLRDTDIGEQSQEKSAQIKTAEEEPAENYSFEKKIIETEKLVFEESSAVIPMEIKAEDKLKLEKQKSKVAVENAKDLEDKMLEELEGIKTVAETAVEKDVRKPVVGAEQSPNIIFSKLEELYKSITQNIKSLEEQSEAATHPLLSRKLTAIKPKIVNFVTVSQTIKNMTQIEKAAKDMVTLQNVLMDIYVTFDDLHDLKVEVTKCKIEDVKVNALAAYDFIEKSHNYISSEDILLKMSGLVSKVLETCTELRKETERESIECTEVTVTEGLMTKAKQKSTEETITDVLTEETNKEEPKQTLKAELELPVNQDSLHYFNQILQYVESTSIIVNNIDDYDFRSQLSSLNLTLASIVSCVDYIKNKNTVEKSKEKIVTLQKNLMGIFLLYDDLGVIEDKSLNKNFQKIKNLALNEHDVIDKSMDVINSQNILEETTRLCQEIHSVCEKIVQLSKASSEELVENTNKDNDSLEKINKQNEENLNIDNKQGSAEKSVAEKPDDIQKNIDHKYEENKHKQPELVEKSSEEPSEGIPKKAEEPIIGTKPKSSNKEKIDDRHISEEFEEKKKSSGDIKQTKDKLKKRNEGKKTDEKLLNEKSKSAEPKIVDSITESEETSKENLSPKIKQITDIDGDEVKEADTEKDSDRKGKKHIVGKQAEYEEKSTEEPTLEIKDTEEKTTRENQKQSLDKEKQVDEQSSEKLKVVDSKSQPGKIEEAQEKPKKGERRKSGDEKSKDIEKKSDLKVGEDKPGFVETVTVAQPEGIQIEEETREEKNKSGDQLSEDFKVVDDKLVSTIKPIAPTIEQTEQVEKKPKDKQKMGNVDKEKKDKEFEQKLDNKVTEEKLSTEKKKILDEQKKNEETVEKLKKPDKESKEIEEKPKKVKTKKSAREENGGKSSEGLKIAEKELETGEKPVEITPELTKEIEEKLINENNKSDIKNSEELDLTDKKLQSAETTTERLEGVKHINEKPKDKEEKKDVDERKQDSSKIPEERKEKKEKPSNIIEESNDTPRADKRKESKDEEKKVDEQKTGKQMKEFIEEKPTFVEETKQEEEQTNDKYIKKDVNEEKKNDEPKSNEIKVLDKDLKDTEKPVEEINKMEKKSKDTKKKKDGDENKKNSKKSPKGLKIVDKGQTPEEIEQVESKQKKEMRKKSANVENKVEDKKSEEVKVDNGTSISPEKTTDVSSEERKQIEDKKQEGIEVTVKEEPKTEKLKSETTEKSFERDTKQIDEKPKKQIKKRSSDDEKKVDDKKSKEPQVLSKGSEPSAGPPDKLTDNEKSVNEQKNELEVIDGEIKQKKEKPKIEIDKGEEVKISAMSAPRKSVEKSLDVTDMPISQAAHRELGKEVTDASIKLSDQSRTRTDKSSNAEAKDKRESRSARRAPNVDLKLTNRNSPVGSDIKLTCSVSGVEVKIDWYKDKTYIENSNKYRKTFNDGLSCLEIKAVDSGDAGVYRCVATNRNGEVETSCLVTVYDVPTTKFGTTPIFTRNIRGMQIVFHF